jgi:hypothetical protein
VLEFVQDQVRLRERSGVRWVVGVGYGDDAHAGGSRCSQAIAGVLDRNTSSWFGAQTSSRLQVDVGRWFAVCHLVARYRDREERSKASAVERNVD